MAVNGLVNHGLGPWAKPVDGGPITISKGGTYSGLNVSGTIKTPAITINTSEPVSILRSKIQFSGVGVQSNCPGSRITIYACQFNGENPNLAGAFTEGAIDISDSGHPGYLAVTQCTIVNSGKVAVYVDGAPQGEAITIDRNWFINLQGSPSDGVGGWTRPGGKTDERTPSRSQMPTR